jgi:hypothetical protein
MEIAVRLLTILLAIAAVTVPSLHWRRAAFAGFVVMGLLYFPLRAGWPAAPLVPRSCELLVGPALALYSFRNFPHIVLFALCFPLARAQSTGPRADTWALLLTVGVGALVELAEAISGQGHCRLRDLLPDTVGALLGWGALNLTRFAWRHVWPHTDGAA